MWTALTILTWIVVGLLAVRVVYACDPVPGDPMPRDLAIVGVILAPIAILGALLAVGTYIKRNSSSNGKLIKTFDFIIGRKC